MWTCELVVDWEDVSATGVMRAFQLWSRLGIYAHEGSPASTCQTLRLILTAEKPWWEATLAILGICGFPYPTKMVEHIDGEPRRYGESGLLREP